MHWFLVFVGGGIGATARHGINRLGLAVLGPGFPWWTMSVNVIGSFLIGLLAGLLGSVEAGQNLRLFLTTGILGGFTTFSAFSLDVMLMLERGDWVSALGYILASVIGAVAALALGLGVARAVA